MPYSRLELEHFDRTLLQTCARICRVSNLKYGSVPINSKTVVFIRANPGKKETTDGSSSHVIFFRDRCTFSEVVSCEKSHMTKNLGSR